MTLTRYIVPKSLNEAMDLLFHNQASAVVLAGGQTLVQEIKKGIINPKVLIDIQNLEELKYIQQVDNELIIGAGVTHSEIANSLLIKEVFPSLSKAAKLIADTQIRNKATMGGTLAYGDSFGDYWGLLYATDASIKVKTLSGERIVPVTQWLSGRYKVYLNLSELVTGVKIPIPSTSTFHKVPLFHVENMNFTIIENSANETKIAICGINDKPLLITLFGNEVSLYETFTEKIESFRNNNENLKSEEYDYRFHLAKVVCFQMLKGEDPFE
ncbi:FAD binding domain-containing protein [Priestia koreensis]|uniref:FAD binding domain-containing protein n=1 Tax=Priestia koreensis TaxID=284581 RepID=UPI003D0682FA